MRVVSILLTLGLTSCTALPTVEERKPAGPGEPGLTVDHGLLERVLSAHVTADGLVDYVRLRQNSDDLAFYLDQLAQVPFDRLVPDERLAVLINAYNAFTLRLVLDHWPIDSIQNIPEAERWDAVRWRFAGETVSLSEIEQDYLRNQIGDVRYHFAINRASRGSPALRRSAYTGAAIDEELREQAVAVHRDPRYVRVAANRVLLTPIYEWYAPDFERSAGSVTAYAARFSPALAERLEKDPDVVVDWLDYDWRLNRSR